VTARRKLNDPTRIFYPDEKEIDDEDFQITRVLNPRVPNSARTVKTGDRNNRGDEKLRLSSKVIDLGNVKANTEAKSTHLFCKVSKSISLFHYFYSPVQGITSKLFLALLCPD
jgi:hypothetical protein